MAEYLPQLADELSPIAAARHRAAELPTLAMTPVVILAGGRGTRLAPYTSVLPKPLMPVGEHSILEIVVRQLADCGATNVNLCVGYLAHLIRAVFDHRAPSEVDITYVHEEDALGTAAPLRLVNGLDQTFIVMNGDVLTMLDYRDILRHHREHGNILTIATHNRAIKIDYGMLHLDVAERLRGFEEKPEILSPVSMGIYAMEPEVLEYIPEDGAFDFPDLVHALLDRGEQVGAYRYGGMWFDIGRADDYERAVAAWGANGIAAAPSHVNGKLTAARSTNGATPSALVPRSRATAGRKPRRKRGV
jgi:NDP-mannose synthase